MILQQIYSENYLLNFVGIAKNILVSFFPDAV